MYFTDATEEDIARVKNNLREIDIDSYKETSQSDDVDKCFDFTVEVAEKMLSIIDDGVCIALAGICKDPQRENYAYVWLTGTPEVEKKVRSFINITKAIHHYYYQTGGWDGLVSYVDIKNQRSLKWATKWLGFKHTRDIDNFGQAKRLFHEIIHTREQYEEDFKEGRVWLDSKGKELWKL